MTTLLAEQPLIVSLMLAMISFGLIYGWLQTGKRAAAIAGLVTLAMIPAAWITAANWETDREQIRDLIQRTAEAVEAERYDEVYQLILSPEAQAQARNELPNFEFAVAAVNRIRNVEIIPGSFPPEADVDMSVKVTVSDRRGRFREVRVVRRLLLRLQKNGEQWGIIEYQHLPITGGPDAFSNQDSFGNPRNLTPGANP